jgi:hypothetical protein
MQTTRQYYRVDRRQISMIRFVFEAYEGVAVVTTLDAAAGSIVLAVAPGCEATARDIMADLGRDFLIESMPPDGDGPERGDHAQQISIY